MPQIHFNGKTYNDIAEMPANERQAYEQMVNMLVDKNGNGIPDFLEGDIIKNITSFYTAAKSVHYNGNVYNNVNELPPDVQVKVQSALAKAADMGVIPQDDYEEHVNRHPVHNEAYVKSTPFISREYNPVIQEDKGPNIIFLVLAGIGFFLCLGIGVALLLFSI